MTMLDLRKPPVKVIAVNAWLGGKLAKAAAMGGINVKKFWYFRDPPPWSRYREYKRGASEAQKLVWETFRQVAKMTAKELGFKKGKTTPEQIHERIMLIKEAMSGLNFKEKGKDAENEALARLREALQPKAKAEAGT